MRKAFAILAVVLLIIPTGASAAYGATDGWSFLTTKTGVGSIFPSGVSCDEVVNRGSLWTPGDVYSEVDTLLKSGVSLGGFDMNKATMSIAVGSIAGIAGYSLRGGVVGLASFMAGAAFTYFGMQKLGEASATNKNLKPAAKRAIEIACQNFLYLYPTIDKDDPYVTRALNSIKIAVTVYNRAGFEKRDLDEVVRHVVDAINYLGYANTAAAAGGGGSPIADMPFISGGIYIGLPGWFKIENIATYENAFELVVPRSDWTPSIQLMFNDAKDLITFAERVLGLNMGSIKVRYVMVWAEAHRENVALSEIRSNIIDILNTVVETIKSELADRHDMLISAGATPDFVSRCSKLLQDYDRYARTGDYSNLKAVTYTILKFYEMERERVQVINENQLTSIERYYREVQALVGFASARVSVGDIPIRLSRAGGEIEDVKGLLRRGEIVAARTKLDNIAKELYYIESATRALAGEALLSCIEVIPIPSHGVTAVKNAGNRVYFRQILIVKNKSGVTLSGITKTLCSLPEGLASAGASYYRYTTNMDARVYFSGGSVLMDIISAAPDASAQVNIWYWLPALDISQSYEVIDATDEAVTIRYSVTVRNTTDIDIIDLPLALSTGLPAQIKLKRLNVIRGGTEGKISEGNVIVKTSLAPGETANIVYDLIVEGIDKSISLVWSPFVEAAENEYSDYVLKAAVLRLNNLLGMRLENVCVNIAVPARTHSLRVSDRNGNPVREITVPPGIDVVSVPFVVDSLPPGGTILYLTYYIQNEKVWTARMISLLDENIRNAESRLGLARRYGLTYTGAIEDAIADARRNLSIAQQAYSQNDYALARKHIMDGMDSVGEALSILDNYIQTYMDAHNRAQLYIDEAENSADKLEKTIGDLAQIIPQDILSAYRQTHSVVVEKIRAARQELLQNRPAAAQSIAKEAKDLAEMELGNIKAYVSQAISGLSVMVSVRLADLRVRLEEAERYGVDTSMLRSTYLNVAENRYAEGLKAAGEGMYATAKGHMDDAFQTATRGVDMVSASLNGVGRNILRELDESITSLKTKLQSAWRLLENYRRAVGPNEPLDNYISWRRALTNLNDEVQGLDTNISIIRESAEGTNDYIMVLRNENTLRSYIADAAARTDNILQAIGQAVDERKNAAGMLLTSMEQLLLNTRNTIGKIREINSEMVSGYEKELDNISQATQRARELYDAGAYTLARDHIASHYGRAAEIYASVVSIYSSLPNPLVGRVTVVMIVVLVCLAFVAAWLYRRNKLQVILQGSLRNPEGTTYPPI